MKKVISSLLVLILLSTYSLTPLSERGIHASEISEASNFKTTSLSEEVIHIADKYITLQTDPIIQYIIKDRKGLKNELSIEEFENVNQKVEETNLLLRDVTNKDLKNASVSSNTIIFHENPNLEIGIASTGKTSFEHHWWGFNLFLNDHWTRTTYQMLYAGSGGAALYARLAPAFTAPTAILKAALYSVAAAGAGIARLMQSENNGKGVRIRFTKTYVHLPIWTGVFPQ